MTVASSLLLLADDSLSPLSGAPMLSSGLVGDRTDGPGVLDLAAVDAARWQAIVVHHSGAPAGNAASLHRLHQDLGLTELGYHFVIGNGDGMEDGVIHVGRRWITQRPGVHAVGPQGDWFNGHAIAICLIGNGEARPFTERQAESLAYLVRTLQRGLAIPRAGVILHRDIADVQSPGRFFPEASFLGRLLDDPR